MVGTALSRNYAILCRFTVALADYFSYYSAAAESSRSSPPPELAVLCSAYPDVTFAAAYERELGDWRISVEVEGRRSLLYYADGRFLKKENLATQENYRRLIYPFPQELADPQKMSSEQIDRFTRFGATENRRRAPVSAGDFFDAIYDTASRAAAEKHIAAVDFLGLGLRVHRRIVPALKRVEQEIRRRAAEDGAAAQYVSQLESGEAFQWRQIRDTAGRSFHSMGLAIDLLPEEWRSKTIYWLWEKNSGNERWMMIPLEQRWMPPESVITAFEEEGFIWGGKWPVWDNMHFEYRPELLIARDTSLLQ